MNTCNGNDCADSYAANHEKQYSDQPLAWTENEGWFQQWTSQSDFGWDNRTPQDMANVVAKWFAVGASHRNYYMYHGGNHNAGWAGSGITNMYADGVNYHSDSLPNEPKRSHLNQLHVILGQYNAALMSTPKQYGKGIPLGNRSLSGLALPCSASRADQVVSIQYVPSPNNISRIGFTNPSVCIFGVAGSDPVPLAPCGNDQDMYFDWLPSSQIKGHYNGQCLDADLVNGALDMWPCKDPSTPDSANQKWSLTSGAGPNLVSASPGNLCATAAVVGSAASAYVYGTGVGSITFLVNTGTLNQTVSWNGAVYALPGNSVVLLDHQGTALFDTSAVSADGVPTQRVIEDIYNSSSLSWEYYSESLAYPDAVPSSTGHPIEQLNVTRDISEYLVYEARSASFGNGILNIPSRKANAFLVFVDGVLVGQPYDAQHDMGDVSFTVPIVGITNAAHRLTLVSVSLGVNNGIANQQPASSQDRKGIVGPLTVGGAAIGGSWFHRTALSGEIASVYTKAGGATVAWVSGKPTSASPLTWYRATFPRPAKSAQMVLLLDIGASGMNRGHFYLNGEDLGRYWSIDVPAGVPVQRYYFLPPDLIQESNLLVLVDEVGGCDTSSLAIVHTYMVVPAN